MSSSSSSGVKRLKSALKIKHLESDPMQERCIAFADTQKRAAFSKSPRAEQKTRPVVVENKRPQRIHKSALRNRLTPRLAADRFARTRQMTYTDRKTTARQTSMGTRRTIHFNTPSFVFQSSGGGEKVATLARTATTAGVFILMYIPTCPSRPGSFQAHHTSTANLSPAGEGPYCCRNQDPS